jgi:glutamate 5-kinase
MPRKGRLNRAWLESFAADVAACANAARKSFWCRRAPLPWGAATWVGTGKLKLEESQAAAAVGQIRLAHAYKELLDAFTKSPWRRFC